MAVPTPDINTSTSKGLNLPRDYYVLAGHKLLSIKYHTTKKVQVSVQLVL
jgi:hypothetical protein